MPSTLVVVGEFVEGADFWTMWRPTGANNAVLFLADVSSVAIKLFDLSSSTPDVAIYSEAPAAATVMFASATVDGYWDLDDIGYTFRYRMQNANFPAASPATGGRVYRLCVYLTTSAWGAVPLIVEAPCRSALSV